MLRAIVRCLLMALIATATTMFAAQKPELVRPFDYDAAAPLGIVELGKSGRGAADVHDITYVSPKGGNVPAYLVVPKQRGRFAAILWGHWYWENSPQRNRSEFLAEAVALAQAGVVSLLTDGPIARPGHVQNREPLNEQQATDLQQQVIDMRRGADLLLQRADVDPTRLAYVGHSYNATVGGILSGVDRRFKAFVLMAGTLSDQVDLQSQDYQDFRTRIGPEKFDAFVAAHAWMDPGQFVAHAAPAHLFLQYATRENFLTPSRVREYEKLVSNPKRFKLYDAPHALNAAARRDRIAFLTEQLQLAKLPPGAVDAIPDLAQPPAPQR